MNANMLWFTARGAGLSAMLVLSLCVTLGAFGSQRIKSSSTRVVVQYLHRTAALLGLALIFVHVSTLVLDSKSHITLAGSLVPFAAQYRPNSVALGSIAMYVLVFVVAVGLARGRMAASRRGARWWRALHLLSYPAWAVAVLHGLLSGTDRSQRWVVLMTIVCVAAVLTASVTRLLTLPVEGPAADLPRERTRAAR